jgi:glycosyltransferase involved in cell wall biosynthesis
LTSDKKILVVASIARSLIYFRGDFIQCLIAEGYTVYTAAPASSSENHQKLLDLGVIPCYYKVQRTGLNPFKDIMTLFQLSSIIRKNGIDLVFPYTIKPVIYSSVAARFLKVPVISLITGLGFTFSNSTDKAARLQKLTEVLYRIGLSKNRCVIFQNPDDLALFRELKLVKPTQKVAVVNGSGVHLERYPHRISTLKLNGVRFVIVARLIREKGIHLYLQVAEQIKQQYPDCEFHVIGSPDSSSNAIEISILRDFQRRKVIIYHGSTLKVPQLLSNCDVFVLPSFYREGIPRSILEALSIGMPVITTDTPGCRETVLEGENGFLIEPKNGESLYKAMIYFIENPGRIKPMGLASRKMAEEKFDVRLINNDLLEIINKELNQN